MDNLICFFIIRNDVTLHEDRTPAIKLLYLELSTVSTNLFPAFCCFIYISVINVKIWFYSDQKQKVNDEIYFLKLHVGFRTDTRFVEVK